MKEINKNTKLSEILPNDETGIETEFRTRYTDKDEQKTFRRFFNMGELTLHQAMQHVVRQARIDYQNGILRNPKRTTREEFYNMSDDVETINVRPLSNNKVDKVAKAKKITDQMSSEERREYLKEQMKQLGIDSIDEL